MTPLTVPTQSGQPPERTLLPRWALAAGALLAGAALVPVYLLPELPDWAPPALGALQVALVVLFAVDRLGCLRAAEHRDLFLRGRGMDLSLLAASGAAVVLGLLLGGRLLPAAGMYLLLSRLWRLVPRRVLTIWMNVVLALTGLAAVGVLVLEYGFREPLPVGRPVLHMMQTAVMAMFILDRLVRLEHARARRAYLRENWVDFALLAAAAVGVAAVRQVSGQILSAGALYVIITQAYILVALVLRTVSVNLDFAGSGVHPTWMLVGSFGAMCLVGSGLLMLPAATPEGMQPRLYYDQALFTATSATCVTGLVVRDTGREFTAFGQAVILALIQLGGLGIMLFGTVLALLVGKGLSVRSSDALGQVIGTEGIGRLVRVVKFVIAMTVAFELLGAVLLYPMFAAPQGPRVPTTGEAVWNSAFHSISAFCNAGFSLHGNNMMRGVAEGWPVPLREHWQMLGVIAPLIVLGGIGFPVLDDLFRFLRAAGARFLRRVRARGRTPVLAPRPNLSLHSKIVLASSAALIALGAAGILLLGPRAAAEGQRIGRVPLGRDPEIRQDPSRWANLPAGSQVREAVFQSITARTAGFNTLDMRSDMTDAGRLLMCGLMVVGGSPASTAGGMKTATFAVLLLATWSMIKRRDEVEAFRRTISAELLRRTVTLAVLYLGLLGGVTLLLCATMPEQDFLRLFFEACSACGTVGLSTGITPKLGLAAKAVVIVAMFAGRVGPLTLLLALTVHMRHVRYSYPSENVVIG